MRNPFRKRWAIVHVAPLLSPPIYTIKRTFWTRAGAEAAVLHALRKYPCPEGAHVYVEYIP